LLDWPSAALARVDQLAPALSRLVAADAAPSCDLDGAVAAACRACGIAKQLDWPVAPWLAHAAGIDAGGAYWLCADPARYLVGATDAYLAGLLDDVDAADAATLVALLNAHFAGDGIRFLAPTPTHWFVCADPAPQIVTRPPDAALGAALAPHLAAGPDATRWRKWHTEMQMLLFEHAVNRRREAGGLAPVDSVWLWGGGRLAPRAGPAPRIFAAGGLVCALAASAGLATAALPTAFSAVPLASECVVWLEAPAAEAGGAPLAATDAAWLAPAERALRAGALQSLELVLTGRTLALAFHGTRPSFAQRWQQRVARPRAAPQLARLVAEAAGG
jgi:hypothetical protein